jgi:DNA-directed RNA polymerase subunit RPC12/RpoP
MPQYAVEIIVIAAVVILVVLLQNWRTANYDYQCGKCGERFSLSTLKAIIALHSMGSKLVRCPKCGKMTWAKPVPKEHDS